MKKGMEKCCPAYQLQLKVSLVTDERYSNQKHAENVDEI